MIGIRHSLMGILAIAFLAAFSSCKAPEPVKPQQGFEDVEDGILEGEVKPASFEEIYTTVRDVLKLKGVLTLENELGGKLEADIGDSHVKVHLIQMELDRGYLRIHAFKQATHEPDLERAREVYGAVLEARVR